MSIGPPKKHAGAKTKLMQKSIQVEAEVGVELDKKIKKGLN